MKLHELHEQQLNESAYVLFGQHLASLGMPLWQTMLIYLAATVGPIAAFLAVMNAPNIVRLAKRTYAEFKRTQKVSPADIIDLKAQMDEVHAKMSAGEKSWLTQLAKRLDSAETKSTKAAIKSEIEAFIAKRKQ